MKTQKICARMTAALLLFATLLSLLPAAMAVQVEEPVIIASEPMQLTETTEETPRPDGRAVNTAAYLDIPVEVLDFRADGFMFESKYTFGSPYCLSENSPTLTLEDGTTLKRPGKYEWGENPETENYAFYIEGLIEDELYYDATRDQKRIVYKYDTIEYIAHALYQGIDIVDPAHYDAHWNDVFRTTLEDKRAAGTLELGSWEHTRAKIEGNVNGGVLLFSQVDTCFDLSYYMLSNIWGSVPQNDILRKETTNTGDKDMRYNMVVPELTKLRLAADGNGNYTFKSKTPSTYNATEGYIYNGGSSENGLPALNIVKNLGFEHPDYFGNDSTGYKEERLTSGTYRTQRNYYYTLHAHSAFVYYEEANLQFEFVGDDDVYFFVNDTLICDIGGVHGSPKRTRNLNDYAQRLGLKEGDICTFDMFFGDRHLTSINLHFTTNIVMMDESVITTKEQYDPMTGAQINDGVSLLSGSPIGYGFSMRNRREFGVQSLTLKDTSLGVTLSSSTVALNGKAEVGDLKLVYQTYDPSSEADHTTPSSTVTYSTFKPVLSNAVTNPSTTINPLATGTYILSGLTVDQIKDLLKIGLPAHTRLSISGLNHTVPQGTYVNTVETTCIPRDISGNLGGVINGSASRKVIGLELTDVISATPAQIVIDYSKPVEFYPMDLLTNIDYDTSKYSMRFVGLRNAGANGAASMTEPKNVGCKANGDSIEGANGTYTRRGEYIRFQLNKMLSDIERSYLVYAVVQGSTIVHYMMLELQIIPANEMYYETDFAEDVFAGEANDSNLFFDFTNTEADQKRYNSRNYAYTNYDVGNWSVNTIRNTKPVFDNEAGTMSISCNDLNADSLIGTNYYDTTQYYVQLGKYFMNSDFLNYNPANTEVVMMRLKLKGLKHKPSSVEAGSPMRMTVSYFVDGSKDIWTSGVDVPESACTDDEYVTLVFDSFTDDFLTASHINTFRFTFSGTVLEDLNTPGEIVFDYIYVGPRAEAPERPSNNLFFDFSADSAAQERYAHDAYGGYNYDTSYWGSNTTSTNRFTFNHTEGTMSVIVPHNANATAQEARYFGVTNTPHNYPWSGSRQYAPLKYVPGKDQYLQIRMKFLDLKAVSGTSIKTVMHFHNTEFVTQTVNGEKKKVPTYAYNNQEFTVDFVANTYFVKTVAIDNLFESRDIINSIGFTLYNLTGAAGEQKDGSGYVVVDYIYIGPKEELPIQESVSFDFTNSRSDRARYNTHTYGKLNYDVGSWTYATDRMSAPVFDNVAGTMSSQIDNHSNETSTQYYLQTSPNLQSNFKMHFDPTNATKAQIRFKMEDILSTGANPKVRLVAFKYEKDDQNVDTDCLEITPVEEFPVNYLSNGEYLTITFDTNERFRKLAEVTTIRIRFDNLAIASKSEPGTITLDYMFVGSEEELEAFCASRSDTAWKNLGTPQDEVQDLSYGDEAIVDIGRPTEDYLLLAFENDDASKARYDMPVYGGNENGVYTDDRNYDVSGAWSWHADRNQNPDFSSGAMSFEMKAGAKDDYYWFDCKRELKYTPKANQSLYFRIKCDSAVATRTSGLANFTIGFYRDTTDNRYGTATVSFSVEEANNGYIDLSIPLTRSDYIAADIIAFRLGLQYLEPIANTTGRFYIDYLFIGTEEEAKSILGKELFIGFTDSVSDNVRYRDNLAFNGINRDQNNQWSVNSYFTKPAIDYDEGTMSFQMNATGYEKNGNPYVQLGTSIAASSTSNPKTPWTLRYDPSEAEIFQIRFKLENFVKNGNPNFTVYHFITEYKEVFTNADGTSSGLEILNEASAGGSSVVFDFDRAGEDYIVLNMPLNDRFKNAKVERSTYSRDEDFITSLRLQWYGIKSASDTKLGKVTIDYIYIGTEEGAPMPTTYGYDTSYEDDTKFSNGSTLSVEGMGIPTLKQDKDTKVISVDYDNAKAYTASSFDFTGTGFDIISQTGKAQGALRAVIFDSKGNYIKAVSVLNKTDKYVEFYQVPVISVNDLPHDTYHVELFVNAAYDYGNDGNKDSYKGDLDRGGEFHFDAVRIYNPLGASNAVANPAYDKHFEAKPTISEIRKLLIDAKSYTAGGTMAGAVYLEKGDTNAEIATYQSLGPNNEVYLAPNQAVAFKLVVGETLPKSIDIGAKSADGKPANLTVAAANAQPSEKPAKQNYTITSCTAQFCPVEITTSKWVTSGTEKYTFVTVYNSGGSGILSLTDIKCAYKTADKTTKSIRFVVDDELIAAVNASVFEENDYEPVFDESLTVNSDITVGAEMAVNYSIVASKLNVYQNFFLEVTKYDAYGEELVTTYGADHEQFNVVFDPVTGETLLYSAVYRGINAKEMGDIFSATLYAVDADGRQYYGESVTGSIKDALLEKLNAPDATAEAKTMAADMLVYGAAAQRHLGYNAENLVTDDLTGEQLSYATKTAPEATDRSALDGEGANVKANITVGSKVQLNLSTICTEVADASSVKCVITDEDGNILAELPAGVSADVMFSAKYDNVGAREMRKMICATFYDADGDAISKTLNWSVESFVAQIRANAKAGESEINMVNTMLAYGDSVAAYLTSIGR